MNRRPNLLHKMLTKFLFSTIIPDVFTSGLLRSFDKHLCSVVVVVVVCHFWFYQTCMTEPAVSIHG